MGHYFQYHSVEGMGGPPSEPFRVLTRKPVRNDVIGERIWLVMGEKGTPSRFFLHSTFIADQLTDSSTPGFDTEIRGKLGKLFEPPIPLDDEYWFPAFLQRTGNFAFGFTEITKDLRVVGGLRTLANC